MNVLTVSTAALRLIAWWSDSLQPVSVSRYGKIAESYALAMVALAFSSATVQNASAAVWANTGGLNLARNSHTATLLPNGQVLVAGGLLNTGGTTNGVELYDQATGTSKITGSMTLPRRNHTATLLLNGKVLVTGGVNGNTVL